jgi:hypothetical protein
LCLRAHAHDGDLIMGEKEEKVTQDKSVHIGGAAAGDVIVTGTVEGSTVTASGTSYTTTTQTITIDKMILEKMPTEYRESLQKFTDEVNKDLAKEEVQLEDMKQLQASANEVAKEMADIKPEEGVSFEKRTSISTKLIGLARALVKASPKIAEKIISGTPLAPFSKLVGKGFEKIVARLLKEPT